MDMEFTAKESSALFGLLAESATDIIFKIDREGRVVNASQAIDRLKLPAHGHVSAGTRLLDIVAAEHVPQVKALCDSVLCGERDGQWIEFAVPCGQFGRQWFELQMCSLTDSLGWVEGALGIMRSVDDRHALREELDTARMTDPLTGLANRAAFLARLDEQDAPKDGGSLALFCIDWLNAINLRHGHGVGDRVLLLLADLLRGMAIADGDVVGRTSGDRFALYVPGVEPAALADACWDVLRTLEVTGTSRSPDAVPTTASAGLVSVTGSVDGSLERAELALFRARSKGRNRLEIEGVSAMPVARIA
jgi:diguanylate cyclase (GGDEF)-like protein/PAS domain S-box-containing protein